MVSKIPGNEFDVFMDMLNDISHEDKQRIYDGLLELERTEKKVVGKPYVPHRTQQEFHGSKKRHRLLIGGNRSGKTEAVSREAYWFATGTHPHRKMKVPSIGKIISGQGFDNGINRVIEPKLRAIFPTDFVVKWNKSDGHLSSMQLANGGKIYLGSGKQDESIAMEGDEFDWLIIDEPISYELFVGAMRGLVVSGGPCLMSLTSVESNRNAEWIYNTIYEPWEDGDPRMVNWDVFTMSMEDNLIENGGVLRRENIDDFATILTDDEYDVRVLGAFKKMSGRVYKKFSERNNVCDPFVIPKGTPVYRSIDPHPNKPNSVVWLCDIDNHWYVIRELDHDGLYDALARECVRIEREMGWNVFRAYVDPSLNREDKRGTGKNQAQILNAEFRNLGSVICQFPVKKDNLIPGIKVVEKAIEDNRLHVFRNCPKTIKEGRLYRYDQDSGYPVEKHNDKWDPIRYVMHACDRVAGGGSFKKYTANFNRELYGIFGDNKSTIDPYEGDF